jgi:hypothetical protein
LKFIAITAIAKREHQAIKLRDHTQGLLGYQTLLKAYISEGLRRDEAQYTVGHAAKLIAALKKRGVPESLIEAASKEAA